MTFDDSHLARNSPAVAGQPLRDDAEYERNGVGHVLLYCAPFDDWRRIDVADNHNVATWAEGIRRLVEEEFPQHSASRW